MKKILSYILLFLVIVNLFAPFSAGNSGISFGPNVAEAGDCKFVSATLNPHSGQGNHVPALAGKPVILTVNTQGCQNEYLTGQLIEKDLAVDDPVITFDPLKITNATPNGASSVTLTFLAGEDHCETASNIAGCEITYRLALSDTNNKPNPKVIMTAADYGNVDFFDSTTDSSLELDFLCGQDPCHDKNNWVPSAVSGVTQTYSFTHDVPVVTKDSITVTGTGPEGFDITPNDTVTISTYDGDNKLLPADSGSANPRIYNVLTELSTDQGKTIKYSKYYGGLTPATTYIITIEPKFNSTDPYDSQFVQQLNQQITLQITTLDKDGHVVVPPPAAGANNSLTQNQSPGDVMPECGITSGAKILGCGAQAIYYIIFVPTSFLFALTGKFFDWTFNYSVTSKSYRSEFVVQGWGIIRDLCNMFFIFVLLYIAFATILDLHGFKTKDMIINVIIIGILINFSLFAAQAIIDASNIMARVFYNSNTIAICTDKNCANGVSNATSTPGPNGELQLSAAIVNLVNPQNLIIHASAVSTIKDAGGVSNTEDTGGAKSLGVGTFILITLLAIAVNIVGMFVFFSVGLIFIARVIGLWFSMIFAPLAFFSYTVPGMQSMEMVGWKKWWPELVSMSFLAPVFIFFIYLILKFLKTGLSLISATGADGIGFVMGIVVPFVFIMILLLKAKDIAKDMSGKLGQQITGGIAAVGGLALGGAALGTAFVGRKTVGAATKYAMNSSARTNALSFKDTKDAAGKIKGWNRANPFAYLNVAQKAISGVGKASMAGVGAGLAQIGKKVDPHTGKETNYFTDQSKKVADKAHSTHELDEAAQTVTGSKEAKYKDLTEGEQATVRDKIDRDTVAKELHNKKYEKLSITEKGNVDAHKTLSGSWAASAADVKHDAHSRGEHVHTADDMAASAKAGVAMGEFVNALRKGSYDVRNLSQLKTTSKGAAKMGVGLIAGIASGVRMGLKGSGINHGSGQADFLKDLGHTITEAMKSAKVDVKVEQSHGKSAAEAHGDGHGGGGHH